MDLTTCQIDGLIVDPPSLRGAVVTAVQACGLAKLLGLIIRLTEEPGALADRIRTQIPGRR